MKASFIQKHFHGSTDYGASLDLQDKWADRIRKAPRKIILLGFEYEPVITLGRRASLQEDVIEGTCIKVLPVSRGGQATLHSPGQLVIYPLCNIRFYEKPLKIWVNLLLETTLNTFSILSPNEKPNLSLKNEGVYVGSGKAASLGLRIDRGVSTFGLALNINNELDLFRSIRPCGVSGQEMACVAKGTELSAVFDLWSVQFEQNFGERAGVDKTDVIPQFETS